MLEYTELKYSDLFASDTLKNIIVANIEKISIFNLIFISVFREIQKDQKVVS